MWLIFEGLIRGGRISIGGTMENPAFYVDEYGNVIANSITLQGKVTLLGNNYGEVLDQFGINPDYIKRTPNACKNSGFEWFDPITMKPREWVGDGVVSLEEAWEGKASLKLESGERTFVEFDPSKWDSAQTRVSFRHKGGAVQTYIGIDSNEFEFDPLASIYEPAGDGIDSPSAVKLEDGRILMAYVEAGAIKQGYAANAQAFFADECLTDIETIEASGGGAVSLFWDEGRLYRLTAVSGHSGAHSGIIRLYESVLKDGSDWALVGTLNDYSTWNTDWFLRHMVGIPYVNPSGRWIVPVMYYYWGGGGITTRPAIYTTDNKGVTWTQRAVFGGSTTYHCSRRIGVWDGELWFSYGSISGHGDRYMVKCDDLSGESWSLVSHDSVVGSAYSTLFFEDDEWVYQFVQALGSADLYRTKTPNDVGSWEVVISPIWFEGNSYSSPAMLVQSFSDTLHAFMIAGHLIGFGSAYQLLHLIDNCVEKGPGGPAISQEGTFLIYDAQPYWVYPILPQAPLGTITHGFHMFYFFPIEGSGPIRLYFENVDEEDPCYLDAVIIERDFTGKWPSDYRPGLDSTPPEPHADTHAEGGSDEITPESIGAETPEGAQEKANTAESNAKGLY
jgi:hypothetical protein